MTHLRSILRRTPVVALIVLVVVSGLLTLFTLLLLFNSVNPFQTYLTRSIRVINKSGDHLLITPVGTLGRGYVGPDKLGHKHVLTQFMFKCPALPSVSVKALPLRDGEERVITYDDEVLHFTDLVLCDSKGQHSRIEVSRFESNHWVMSSSNNLILVTASTPKIPLDAETLDIVANKPRRNWTLVHALVAPPFFIGSVIGLALLLRGGRRLTH